MHRSGRTMIAAKTMTHCYACHTMATHIVWLWLDRESRDLPMHPYLEIYCGAHPSEHPDTRGLAVDAF